MYIISKEPFDLDLKKVRVYGYRNAVSVEVLESLERAIIAGERLPPVLVERINTDAYFLASTFTEPDPTDATNIGGNHRLALAYVLGIPLPVIEVKHCAPIDFRSFLVLVNDIILESDPGALLNRIQSDKQYLGKSRYR